MLIGKEPNEMSKPTLHKEQYSQLLERLNLAFSFIDEHLIQHPVCKIDKEISNSVEEALSNIYQGIIQTKNRREIL